MGILSFLEHTANKTVCQPVRPPPICTYMLLFHLKLNNVPWAGEEVTQFCENEHDGGAVRGDEAEGDQRPLHHRGLLPGRQKVLTGTLTPLIVVGHIFFCRLCRKTPNIYNFSLTICFLQRLIHNVLQLILKI